MRTETTKTDTRDGQNKRGEVRKEKAESKNRFCLAINICHSNSETPG